MKRVMILTAERTGTGHKSAANAIQKRLDNSEYEINQIDCFTMMGKIGMFLENSYIPTTTKFPYLEEKRGILKCKLPTHSAPD